MLQHIIRYSLRNKFIVFLFVVTLIALGIHSLLNIPIGAVPDVTNNQVQVITTSRDLPTEEVERYLTYPVELEMANLPGVVEIRSISKFGLSVVTVVFEEDMGTYLPRQLIAEKIKTIEERIPEGFGSPTMGPISTGLGEIYQYILDVKPGYKDQYSVTDLRTIQDWIVKRQLSGTPGVVEVNTWGGFLKTFEIAVNPEKIKALDISLSEVYDALKNNNSVAGGGYIEKKNEAYFIRADGSAKSIEDLKNIVITHKGSSPIFIKDIASVGYGTATRFGAISGNGEGEKVLGQVMMLKGANSKKVIDNVIKRVEEIQPSLPEGVFINPFLERSELIGRTTNTIAENLILGFLIVLFVVVFLLGNIRSGLVVASVIPLTLLFALTMMRLFGVDANLMSLGAIDFGIIIDGAVIIIEYIAFTITQNASKLNPLSVREKRIEMDNLVLQGSYKMMHSAVFGQIIIIIVFIPILILSGIEGKMFRPMALTFCFALIGAMILCFTYVPVMASLFLKPRNENKRNISSRFINAIKNAYKPILISALNFRKTILGIALALLMVSAFLFTKLGGEFVPTLDEGDFVIQPVLKTGMSLSATVDMTTRIEQIVMKFPEVKQVVTRIGAAEVPTDPMSMEESDIIITLKEKKDWTSADSKDMLADVFKEAIINEIPGIEIEFTQPIEMRFNELISGARSDLAIKLFGEDLDILYNKAEEIENVISNIEGASDISVEKIDGLPQMSVKYDRNKMARYGVSISELNDIISMGFAGKKAGTIFEGESQFDVVIKYDKDFRNDIDHLRSTMIKLNSGNQLPLDQFAEIKYTSGPAKISRDDTKRRVVVGVNIRNRDLQSVVDDIQTAINKNVSIPSGYYIKYGGQFENLQNASKRLLFAVPVALILIFILLFFAFHSLREALLVYSAIPFAIVGGILSLHLRGMPFSISAGVGFIALFGIAVLNGIVLIEHFKELKSKGMENLNDIIVKGAIDRIRPVLLTAIAAAFGFLPMAISTSAGAEVQRPLATVVIGGLISATLLTLIVMPVLYRIFGNKSASKSIRSKSGVIIILLSILPFFSHGQDAYTIDQILEKAIENNLGLKAELLKIDAERAMVNGVKEIGKTNLHYQYDENNISNNGQVLHVLGIGQNFNLPIINKLKKQAQEGRVKVSAESFNYSKHQLLENIYQLYDKASYLNAQLDRYKQIDNIYSEFLAISNKKFQLKESNILEHMTAQQKKDELALNIKSTEVKKQQIIAELERLSLIENLKIKDAAYTKLVYLETDPQDHPIIGYYQSVIEQSQQENKAIEKMSLPDFNVSLFHSFNSYKNIEFFPGIEAGIAIPFSKKHYKARNTANRIATEIQTLKMEEAYSNLNFLKSNLMNKEKELSDMLAYYDNTISLTQEQFSVNAEKAYKGGEINYLDYLQIIGNVNQSKLKRLDFIHEYSQTIISLNHLQN
ncbi:MAG: CusA/CzcA family heavy metal efflux RND transporter [Saprospiraceae bacterium]|nr:CusA/CzcA family heavy metal efflux RND transporter [Saprospiraceae bacterium]